jgi:hypothetical protein
MSVGSFSDNVGLGRVIFSVNVGMKLRCFRAERFIFSGRYTYRDRSAEEYEQQARQREIVALRTKAAKLGLALVESLA